jgi:hypothetical protein
MQQALRSVMTIGVTHILQSLYSQQTLENLIAAGKELQQEQELVMEMQLANEYMNSPAVEGGGSLIGFN